jgi:hypothetical protein
MFEGEEGTLAENSILQDRRDRFDTSTGRFSFNFSKETKPVEELDAGNCVSHGPLREYRNVSRRKTIGDWLCADGSGLTSSSATQRRGPRPESHQPKLVRMPKLSLILGVFATVLYTSAWCAMSFLVHGEEDWNLGIALLLSLLAALGISVLGVILSLVSFDSVPGKRRLRLLGLLTNLIPGLSFLLSWIASRIGLL